MGCLGDRARGFAVGRIADVVCGDLSAAVRQRRGGIHVLAKLIVRGADEIALARLAVFWQKCRAASRLERTV
jgi:hypothetical protein